MLLLIFLGVDLGCFRGGVVFTKGVGINTIPCLAMISASAVSTARQHLTQSALFHIQTTSCKMPGDFPRQPVTGWRGQGRKGSTADRLLTPGVVINFQCADYYWSTRVWHHCTTDMDTPLSTPLLSTLPPIVPPCNIRGRHQLLNTLFWWLLVACCTFNEYVCFNIDKHTLLSTLSWRLHAHTHTSTQTHALLHRWLDLGWDSSE